MLRGAGVSLLEELLAGRHSKGMSSPVLLPEHHLHCIKGEPRANWQENVTLDLPSRAEPGKAPA